MSDHDPLNYKINWTGPLLLAAIIIGIIIIMSACASHATGTDTRDWCSLDHFMCKSHADTPATQAEVDQHNTGYVTACPKQPQECK